MSTQIWMAQLGQSGQAIGLSLSVLAVVMGITSAVKKDKNLGRLTLTLVILVAVSLSIAMGCLWYGFHSRDFSLAYVYNHSNSNLPRFYTTAALWGGHEGSLLLWAWLLSVYSALSLWLNFEKHPTEIPWAAAIQMALCGFFMGLILFFSNPFDSLYTGDPTAMIPGEGKNLNPLLQDPGMVIHPPMLYLGYVGFTVPFAFAMAGLLSGRLDGQWLFTVRRWALSAWMFLSVGITLGAFWAYRELGWGGWWGWDPVENASFMPWLLGTAFLHSMMVQEKRRTFKMWTLSLCILTYASCLFGTFLVRSGVLTSVHSFASDPERGLYLLIFMAVVLALSFLLVGIRSEQVRASTAELESVVSREGAFLFNNLLFVVATISVFGGTIYPLVLESIDENLKITVGPPYFNQVFGPLMTGLLLLMGVGPLIPWRRMTTDYMKRNFLKPLITGILGAILVCLIYKPSPGIFIGSFAICFALGGILQEFVFAARKNGKLAASSIKKRVGQNKRKYGGLIIHLGVLFYAFGIMITVTHRKEADYHVRPGDHFYFQGYHVVFQKMEKVQGPNYLAQQATLDVYKNGKAQIELAPQKRDYGEGQMPTTEASILATIAGDLYAVLGEVDEDGRGAVVRFYYNPLMNWLWAGAIILVLGSILSLLHKEKPPKDLEVVA